MRWVVSGLVLATVLGAAEGTSFSQGRSPLGEPPSRAGGAGPTDDERARAIEAQVRVDPVLRDDQLTIEVTGKRVRLSGEVDNVDERRHAEDIVMQSDPTLTVENLLQPLAERQAEPAAATTEKASERSRKAAEKAGKVATEVGTTVNDAWITSKVKAQLMGADGVRTSAIDVDTADQVVTLRGHVRSEAERQKALRIARRTRGVQVVIDELQLLPKAR